MTSPESGDTIHHGGGGVVVMLVVEGGKSCGGQAREGSRGQGQVWAIGGVILQYKVGQEEQTPEDKTTRKWSPREQEGKRSGFRKRKDAW